MDNRLSIVIAFLNEKEEVENTIESIRFWVGNRVDIVVVNDCSDDDYPYDDRLKKFDIVYIVNPIRLGAAQSKALGISKVRTEYFLLLDAHMRFYDADWLDVLISTLDKDDRRILCCQTKVLYKINNQVLEKATVPCLGEKMGAYINFKEDYHILEPEWNYFEKEIYSSEETISCLLGAAYCASKRYWEYLKGYEGLMGFGLEEPYISLKTYLEGGKCVLLKKVIVGHIYRTKFPYRVNPQYYEFNKIAIAYLLLPENIRNYVLSVCPDALLIFKAQKEQLDRLKSYYHSIFSRDFEYYWTLNIEIARKNKN